MSFSDDNVEWNYKINKKSRDCATEFSRNLKICDRNNFLPKGCRLKSDKTVFNYKYKESNEKFNFFFTTVISIRKSFKLKMLENLKITS